MDRKEIIHFALIYGLSRVFFLFMSATLYDQDKIYDLQSFPNLLAYPTINPIYPYPILFSVQFATIFYLFGATMLGFRLGIMIYEVGCLVFLYKFITRFRVQEFQRTIPEAKHTALIGCYLFAFSPFTIVTYFGNSEFPALFFMILGLYFYYKDRIVFSSIFICLGFLTEFFPIFCLVPIIINSLIKRDIKKFAKLVIPFILLFLLVNLPYFYTNPLGILESYADQLSHSSGSVSLWTLFGTSLPTWNILSIQVSLVEITFLIVFLVYCILTIFYFQKKKTATPRQEFMFIIILTLLFPLIFLSFIPFYFFLGFPLFLLFNEPQLDIRKVKTLCVQIIAILIPFSATNFLLWPNIYVSTPPPNGFREYLGTLVFLYSLLAVCYLMIIAFLWVNQSGKLNFFQKRETPPKVGTLLMGVFWVFIIQFDIALVFIESPFYTQISVILTPAGIIISLWIAQKIYRRAKEPRDSIV